MCPIPARKSSFLLCEEFIPHNNAHRDADYCQKNKTIVEVTAFLLRLLSLLTELHDQNNQPTKVGCEDSQK